MYVSFREDILVVSLCFKVFCHVASLLSNWSLTDSVTTSHDTWWAYLRESFAGVWARIEMGVKARRL